MPQVTRVCQNPACGREFEHFAYPSDSPSRGKFCSPACQRKARARNHGPTNWKGGRVKGTDGRMLVWLRLDDPLAEMIGSHHSSGGYALEHRIVMATAIGRPLLRSETVHHLNGDPADNRLENLQLRIRHGEGQVYCCGDCGSRNLRPIGL